MRQVNVSRIPGYNFEEDCSVEFSHGYRRSPQGLKCSPNCKNVWAMTGIHSFLQIEKSEHGPKSYISFALPQTWLDR